MLNYQYIKARDLGDAWFQCLFRMLEEGSVHTIDRGSFAGQKRLEFDFIAVEIEHPGTRPLLPQIEAHHAIPNPVADDYLDDYISYLMTGEVAEGESYTYGQRMTKEHVNYPVWDRKAKKWEDILIQEDEVWKDKNIVRKTEVGVSWICGV